MPSWCRSPDPDPDQVVRKGFQCQTKHANPFSLATPKRKSQDDLALLYYDDWINELPSGCSTSSLSMCQIITVLLQNKKYVQSVCICRVQQSLEVAWSKLTLEFRFRPVPVPSGFISFKPRHLHGWKEYSKWTLTGVHWQLPLILQHMGVLRAADHLIKHSSD